METIKMVLVMVGKSWYPLYHMQLLLSKGHSVK